MEADEININKCQKALEDSSQDYREAKQNLDQLLSWSDIYLNSSISAREDNFTAQIAVRVKREYELEIDFNLAYEQYFSGF